MVFLFFSYLLGSFKGREIVVFIFLIFVIWKRLRCIIRLYEDCIFKIEFELDEILDVIDKFILLESKDNFLYYMRKNLVSVCNFLCDLFIFDVVRLFSFVVLL